METNLISKVADENLADPPVAVHKASGFPLKRAYLQTFSATIGVRLLGAVSGIMAARLLGPVGRGELAVITLLPTMLLPLGEFELPRSLAYSISRDDMPKAKTVSSGLFMALVLGTVQMLILGAAIGWFLPADKSYLLHDSRLFVVYLPLIYLLTCAMGIEQGQANFGRFSLLQISSGLIYVTVILVGYYLNLYSTRLFALGILLGAAIPAVVQATTQLRQVNFVPPDVRTSISILSRGLMFYAPAVAALALSRADTFLLVRMVGLKEVGLYIVAQAIAIGQMGSVSPFVQVGFASVSAESKDGEPLLALAQHFRLAQIAVLAAGLLAIALTPFLLRFAFGPDFQGALYPTYILIIATMLNGLGQVLDFGLRAAGHSVAGTFCNVLGVIVLCVSGIPAAGRFGILGLSSAVFFGYLVTTVALVSFCVFRLRMPAHLLWGFKRSTFLNIMTAAKTKLRSMRVGDGKIGSE